MNKRNSRSFGLTLITLTYLLATLIGFATFNALPFDLWLNILIADVVATVAVFVVSVICHNASVYDPYWSVQPIIIVVAIAFDCSLSISGIIVLSLICLWGVRLTANWI